MMQTRGTVRRVGAPAIALLVVAASFIGCGRNQGDLPAGFAPDGVPSSSTFLISQFGYAVNPDGVVAPGVLLTVLDNGGAEAFQLYRKSDADDSFHEANTFAAPFVGTFNSGFGSYQAVDFEFQENVGVQYVARAVVNGTESKLSTLSSTSLVPAGTEADLPPEPFDMIAPIDTVNTDSLPTLQWQSVPGAERYVVQVVRSDGKPFAIFLTPPDGSTSYTMQSKQGVVIHEAILTRSTYFWAVIAVDAQGFVVGATPSPQIFIVNPPPPPPPI